MAVISRILIIYLMIGTGVALCKLGVLSKESNGVISRLVVLVGSPCLIFSAIVSRELTSATVAITLEMLVVTVAFFIGGSLLAHLLSGISGIKKNNDSGVYMALMTTINASFMGFPLMQAAYGEDGLYLMVIGNIVFNCYLYSYGIILIKSGTAKKMSLTETIKDIINPCIIAAIAGFALLCAHLKVPQILMDPINQIGNITIPLAMISLGISICGSNIKNIFSNKDLIKTCTFKNLIWPIAAMIGFTFIPIDPLVKSVAVLMGTLPPAISMGVLVTKLGGNSKIASQGTVLIMFVCAFTIPLMYFVTTHLFAI